MTTITASTAAWFLLIPTMLAFCLGAWASYTPVVRASPYYLPTIVLVSVLNAWCWCTATRVLNSTDKIILFSLCVDGLMILAYYGGPMLVNSHRLPGQAYMAAFLALASLFWFKCAIE